MKFLLDENVPRGLAPFLLELNHQIKFVPKGIENGQVFKLAISKKRILITYDEDFTDWIKFPPEKHYGILLIRISPHGLEEIKNLLTAFLKEKSLKDLRGKLFTIFLEKIEQIY